MNNILKRLLIHFYTSLALTAVIAIGGIVYALITLGHFTLLYSFNASFVIGAFIILVGLVIIAVPMRLVKYSGNRFIDFDTFGPNTVQAKEEKRKKGFGIMYVGLGVIVIAGFLQLVLYYYVLIVF